MKKILPSIVNLALVSLLIVSCSGAMTPIATSTLPGIPTSTHPVWTPSPTLIATVAPSVTITSKLPISSEASAYLEEALDIMQSNSLYRESIDWEALRKSAFEVAQYAQTPADTYGATSFALSQLGDHHSSFYTPNEFEQTAEMTASDNPAPRGKLLLEKIGFIAIDEFWGSGRNEYATKAQQVIRDLDAQNPCGWIVDLRENNGGRMWALL